MRSDEVNVVAPLDSPELSPATSYAVVFLPSPARLSVAWDPRVSRRSQAGVSAGRVAFGPRQRVFRGPPCPSGRPSSSSLGFQIVLFYSFHRLVYRFKNMYLLVGRFK